LTETASEDVVAAVYGAGERSDADGQDAYSRDAYLRGQSQRQTE